jgi:uncharacterized membrane protein YdcZ (DUF606 family)
MNTPGVRVGILFTIAGLLLAAAMVAQFGLQGTPGEELFGQIAFFAGLAIGLSGVAALRRAQRKRD